MDLARNLRQTATYWAPTGQTDLYGKPVFAAPVALKCRWEERQSQIIDKKGSEVVSKSRVFVLENVSVDGYIYLGTSEATNPNTVDGVEEIQQVGTTPDLRGLKQLVTVYL